LGKEPHVPSASSEHVLASWRDCAR
jgi:hypothetical protein